eukprot:6841893-Prymnesium_polylepis.1
MRAKASAECFRPARARVLLQLHAADARPRGRGAKQCACCLRMVRGQVGRCEIQGVRKELQTN